MKKNTIFTDIREAIIYLIFISFIPILCLWIQFFCGDRSMYIMIFTTIFSTTHDYINYSKDDSMCNRIQKEGKIVVCVLVLVLLLWSSKLMYCTQLDRKLTPYSSYDIFILIFSCVPFVITVGEFANNMLECNMKNQRLDKLQNVEGSIAKGANKI